MTDEMNQDDNKQPAQQVVSQESTANNAVNSADDNLKNLTQLVYILQAISLVVGVTSIAGIILNYLKRDEVKGTFLESHFNWQIKTFWYMLIGVIVGWLLALVLVGFLVWAVVGLWYIYRIVKGWLALNDGKELGDALL